MPGGGKLKPPAVDTAPDSSPRSDRQGWRIIAGLFVVLTMSSGFGFYNMSVYMNVLSEARDFSVSSLSGAVSAFFVIGGIAGLGVARLLERIDVRWILVAGAVISAAALSLVGFAESISMVYLLFIVFGIGNTGVSIVVSTTLVTRWFPGANRSVALSVASTGLSMGGILITPASAWLFEQLGVETAMPAFAVLFVLVIVLVTLLLIRDAPAAPVVRSDSELAGEWTYRDAVQTRFFLLLTAGYVLCMASQVGGIAHLYNHVDGQAGFLVAATAVQALTAMSILSRIVGGFILTRIPIRWFALGNLVGQACGLGLLAVAESRVEILFAAGLFGATVGNLLMLHPLWLADAYGVGAYARLFSLSNAWTVLGVASGPLAMGLLFDFASYRVAYLVALALSLGAAVLVMSAGARPQRAANSARPDQSESGT